MYNTCISSRFTLRSKGSPSFSFNDYCYCLNERSDKAPTSSCSCSAFCVSAAPINPSFLYGFKQSTLIQFSASKRVSLGGRDLFNCRIPICNVHCDCYLLPSYLKAKCVNGRRVRNVKENFDYRVADRARVRHHSYGFNDAEAMISLLAEEVSNEFGSYIERKSRGSKNKSARKFQVEKRRDHLIDKTDAGVNAGSSSLDNKLEIKSKSVGIQTEDDNMDIEKMEDFQRGERNRRVRREGSSVSSYYSVSSLDEFERHTENQMKGEVVGESSNSHRNDPRWTADDLEETVEVSKFENNTIGSNGLGNVSAWEVRKKSEKKLGDSFIEQATYTKNPSENFSKVWVHESKKQLRDSKEASSFDTNLAEEKRKQYSQTSTQQIDLSQSRTKHKQVAEVQKMYSVTDVEANSSSKTTSSAADLVQKATEVYHRTHCQETEEKERRRISQRIANITDDTQFNLIENTSVSKRHFKANMNQEENSTRVSGLGQQETMRLSKEDLKLMKRMEAIKRIQDTTNLSTVHSTEPDIVNNRQNESNSINVVQETRVEYHKTGSTITQEESRRIPQRLAETRVKNREDYLAGTSSCNKEVVGHHTETDEELLGGIGFRKNSHEATHTLTAHGTRDETVQNLQLASGKRITSQGKHLGSGSKLIEKRSETYEETSRRIMEEEIDRNSPVITIPPPSQMVVAVNNSSCTQPTSGLFIQEVSSDREVMDSVALSNPSYSEDSLNSANRLARFGMDFVEQFVEKARNEALASISEAEKNVPETVGSSNEPFGANISTEELRIDSSALVNPIHHEDTTVSADRLENSGRNTVEEFVDKAGNEASISEIKKGEPVSGTKGPSIEIWDVKTPSIDESLKRIESPEETKTTENFIVKRTGRSLWNIIADIIRVRWALRTESPKSAVKSGERSSSKESFSSEAWGSGHETEENRNKNLKKQEEKSFSASGEETLCWHEGKSNSQGTETREMSIPLTEESGAEREGVNLKSRKGVSSSGEENLGWTEGLTRSQSSLPLAEDLRTEKKEGKLFRRKLQRNEQVLKERFEQWEDAYKLESDQRKIDEMFMKEALLEAKKAANTWEVPVGAVLVHNGKIISRGCNLVEELRDSTAHAEMICIREASNVLHTWRLSETTLYVTLEPCAMCAGAILQARIDTVVWGAPNKLLGADGSWIRLFPNGGDEATGSEPTDKPPAPVHPFHPKMAIRRGVLATECADVMQQFFQLRRRNKNRNSEAPSLPVSHHPTKLLAKMQGIFNIMFCL